MTAKLQHGTMMDQGIKIWIHWVKSKIQMKFQSLSLELLSTAWPGTIFRTNSTQEITMDKSQFGISNMTKPFGKWGTQDLQLKILLTLKSTSKSIQCQEKMSTMKKANDQVVKNKSFQHDRQVLNPPHLIKFCILNMKRTNLIQIWLLIWWW